MLSLTLLAAVPAARAHPAPSDALRTSASPPLGPDLAELPIGKVLPNCRGSGFMLDGVTIDVLRNITRAIDRDRLYRNKEYITCAPMPDILGMPWGNKCAYLQYIKTPVSGGRVLELMNMLARKCQFGGSFSLNGTDQDIHDGILTVNYVSDIMMDCELALCAPNCGKAPCKLTGDQKALREDIKEKKARWAKAKSAEEDVRYADMWHGVDHPFMGFKYLSAGL